MSRAGAVRIFFLTAVKQLHIPAAWGLTATHNMTYSFYIVMATITLSVCF